jgi:phenylacetate-CoA ligase
MTPPSFPDRTAIHLDQEQKLGLLLAALLQTNSFYSPRIEAAGISPNSSRLHDFIAAMPFTLKEELVEDQCRHPPYGTNLTYSLERYTRFNQTSGTTGQPLRWLDTSESWDWMLANWTRVLMAAKVSARDRLFFAFSFAPFLGFWTAFEAAVRMGCLCLPGGGLSSAARLRIIQENGVTVLCCTPTYAVRLAEVAAEENCDLAKTKVKTLIVAGEAGGSIPGVRTSLETLWQGARVVDHHGMTETGPVTYSCPSRRGVLHVIESAFIAEVIQPATDQSAKPGEVGELVLTTLGRLGSPLLRYRTGDLVQPLEHRACECGSYELALQGGLLGRTDDVVIVRGVNVYPSALEDVVRTCPGILEYRVEVETRTALPEIKVKVEISPEHTDTVGVVKRLETALRTTFALRIPVSIVPAGSLPRFEMKSKRWARV